jgi:suppressor of IKK-epsilon
MNLSLDTILTNARELVSRLRRDDATADTAVSQAQYVQERILSMKQYGDDLAELNDISSHRPKTAILYSIQKENRLIKQLQKENEELKQLVTEHRSVLEKIMYKYRQHVQQLKLMEEKEKMAVQIFNGGLAQEIQEKTSKIQEMASIMQRAIDIDETNHTTQEERINALLLENKGLKEILAVHEHMHQQKPLSTIISESTTTESSVAQPTTLPAPSETITTNSSSSSS